VGKFDKGIYTLLLFGSLGSTVCLPVQADPLPGNAMIPPMVPDPDPTTANANPSQQILRQTNELSNDDFANVSSGAGINRLVVQGTNNLGGNITTQTQLSNLPAGRSGNSGNGIANMVNSNIAQGLGALKIITGDR